MVVVAQCAADLVDALHEAVVGHGRVRPDRGHQLVLGDETVGIFDQVAENGEALRPEDDGVARRVAQRLVGEIDGDPVDGKTGRMSIARLPRVVAVPGLFLGNSTTGGGCASLGRSDDLTI